jgi:threonine aldolase
MKTFASDNYSGICEEVLQAIVAANSGHATAYGDDPYTQQAIALLKKTFGENALPYFVYNGTAANTLGLQAIVRSHHAIICADSSHINSQETGAVTSSTRCQLISVPHENGKITATALEETFLNKSIWGIHSNKPTVVSIAQSTEYGTLYSIEELRAISAICKKYNLLLHMDGCRLANAAVALQTSLKAITADIGVDVLSFGGTKNGMLFGEAIIFFRKELAEEFAYIRKQGLQLNSKMRFLSAQFIPYLEKNIWQRNALHANKMCQQLAEGLAKKTGVELAYPVQTNQIFAYFPKEKIEMTQEKLFYYVWNEKLNLVRLVTSFDTTEIEVEEFLKLFE